MAALFDTNLLARRYARLSLVGETAMPDFLHRHALGEIVARLSATRRHFERVLLCTLAPWGADRILAEAGNVGEVVLAAPWARPVGGSHQVVIDPGRPAFADASFDLAILLMETAFIDDLPEALLAWRRLLRPDGLFLSAFPGGESLRELRAAWAHADVAERGVPELRVASFLDVRLAGSLLQLAGFAMPVADVERLRLRYGDALSLMQELKALGWSNMLRERSRHLISRRRLARAAAALEAACTEADGRIAVSLDLLYLSGWAAEADAPRQGGACIVNGSSITSS